MLGAGILNFGCLSLEHSCDGLTGNWFFGAKEKKLDFPQPFILAAHPSRNLPESLTKMGVNRGLSLVFGTLSIDNDDDTALRCGDNEGPIRLAFFTLPLMCSGDLVGMKLTLNPFMLWPKSNCFNTLLLFLGRH